MMNKYFKRKDIKWTNYDNDSNLEDTSKLHENNIKILETIRKIKKYRYACRKIFSETGILWGGNLLGLKNIQVG